MKESIFSKWNVVDKRIQESKNKISNYSEIRGLLLSENKSKITGKFKFRSYNRGTVTFEIESPFVKEIEEILYQNGCNFNYNNYSMWMDHLQFVLNNNYLPDIELINFDPIYKPFWSIIRKDKEFQIKWNPITNPYGYYKPLENKEEKLTLIPGYTQKDKYYSIPLSEGWRLYVIHPSIKSPMCEWLNPDDQIEIKKEFEKRIRLKDIHSAEDSICDVIFPHGDPSFRLRPHQRIALEFIELVDRKSIIAYGTGTGKTAIAIADAIKSEAQRILIICPGSLRLNWKRHIENHTGETPIILAGRAPTKDDFKYLLYKQPKWVLINYEILRSVIKEKNKQSGILESTERFPWVELLNLYHPDYIIVDECHNMKNPSSSQSKAVRLLGIEDSYKMALSGTPIMNRQGELWSVLNWLHPKQFPYYETFLKQYGVGRYIGVHETKQLRSLLETILIKRTRQDISKNLPPVNRIVETFEMSKKARKIYNRALQGIYEEFAMFDIEGKGGEIKKYSSILPKINALIKCCAADKVNNTVERAVEISDSIEEEKWNKILIFTHYQGSCNTIAKKLNKEYGNKEVALSFVRPAHKGFHTLDMEKRMDLVDRFQNDPSIKFLVCTEKSAREGLDITKAGVVIFNDLFWTPAAHIQCEGRAFYRESDMHGGDSMYFQLEDSIEEWITELQGVKSNTIEKVVEGKGIEFAITTQIVERLRAMFDKQFKK